MAKILTFSIGALAFLALSAQPTNAQDKAVTPASDAPAAPAAGDKPAGEGEKKLVDNAAALLREVVNKEMEEAVRNGLKALAELQDKEKGFFGNANTRVATTSLAGLAFLASGSLPGTGPYGEHMQKVIDYLLSVQDPNTGYITDPNDDGSRIHGHGYAISFLSQVYGQARESVKLQRALTKAVKLLETGQTKDGGWGYVPSEATWDEGSTTICAMQALRNAQDSGIAVKNETIANAIGYLEKIATPHTIKVDGELQQAYTFMYSLSSGSSSQSYALVAAACACMNNLGVYSKSARWSEKDMGKILDGGMRWMMYSWKQMFGTENSNMEALSGYHYYYANFYAAQAAWQYSDTEYFKYYFPKMRDQLVAEQKRNGGQLWPHSSYGSAFSSALALLILQVPYQYLPAFQR